MRGFIKKIKIISILITLIMGVSIFFSDGNEINDIGWVLVDKKWFYVDYDGNLKIGWELVDGKWYYLKQDGEMAIGWELIDHKWYYLKLDGEMAIGWQLIDGKWYYLKPDGEMATEWGMINGKWYYLKPDGEMATGWELVNSKWYYLKPDGEMAIGWELIDGKWYYMDKDGSMFTGWLMNNGLWYYLDLNGEMLTNTQRDGWNINSEGVGTLFAYSAIPKHIKEKMIGKSMPHNATIKFDDLSYLRLTYYGFDNKTHTGEMVVNKLVEREIIDIFKELYEKRYPIYKIELIDNYDADDNLSMENNNSSAFCYRTIEGSTNLSKHAIGLAVDINPIQNPYVKGSNVYPTVGKNYLNRNNVRKGMIRKEDACYQAFIKRGWTWGGNWNNPDYQHFQK